MNINTLLVSCAAGLVLFSGCSKSENETASAAAPAPAAQASPAAGEPSAPAAPREVLVTGNDSMKFSITRIEASPGEQLRIVLENAGSLPKQAMGHNLVVLQKGTDVNAFSIAASQAVATDYIPANLAGSVIAHTKILGPKEKDEITFTVPSEPGEYPYICSFPAHALAGMRGVLVVR